MTVNGMCGATYAREVGASEARGIGAAVPAAKEAAGYSYGGKSPQPLREVAHSDVGSKVPNYPGPFPAPPAKVKCPDGQLYRGTIGPYTTAGPCAVCGEILEAGQAHEHVIVGHRKPSPRDKIEPVAAEDTQRNTHAAMSGCDNCKGRDFCGLPERSSGGPCYGYSHREGGGALEAAPKPEPAGVDGGQNSPAYEAAGDYFQEKIEGVKAELAEARMLAAAREKGFVRLLEIQKLYAEKISQLEAEITDLKAGGL